MGKIESYVYDLLKDNVRVKNAVKWVYQGLFSAWPGPRKETNLKLNTRPKAFFGFHDKSPWSSDGSLLLGHSFEGEGTGNQWQAGVPAGICVFEGPDWTVSSTVAHTNAWNWQQGAQLQWLGEGRRIVYNDFRDGACVAVVQDLDTGAEILLPHPVAAVSPDGSRYASICFETFGRAMPGYGYAFEQTGATSPVRPCELVVGKVEGGQELEISLSDLGSHLPSGGEMDGIDFFSHCLFSPTDRYLLFLRRQSVPNRRLRSEMFCLDLQACSLRRIDFHNMVSHFTWVSDKNVLAYANTEDEGDGYYIADVEMGTVTQCTSQFHEGDGHPHATPDGDRVVFDTYPDRRRYQRLSLWKEEKEQSRLLARLFSPMKFWGSSRVDLHPRIRADGRYLSFDASHTGVRSLVTAELPPDS
jgi:hypothetical protein